MASNQIFMCCCFQKNYLHTSMRQALGMPPTDRRPLHLQPIVKAMYITIYAKVQINNNTHGEGMSNISVKQ